jgi:hypothetical protein
MTLADRSKALEKLRGLLAKAPKALDGYQEILDARDGVIARFQPLFRIESVDRLDAAQFRSFLLFENNRHWSGLHRHSARLCADMAKLRAALALLLDEEKPLPSRWDTVIRDVPGMGKAIVSAILLIAHPDRYGVWNNTSESSLRALGLWPEFEPGTSSGENYATVNALLNQVANALHIDLWTLDALLTGLKPREGPFHQAEIPRRQLSDDQLAELDRRCDVALACETAQEQRDELGKYIHVDIPSLPQPLRDKFIQLIDDLALKSVRP